MDSDGGTDVNANANANADADGDDGAEDQVPEPPAVVGSWTFPMKGMFPAPRPWSGGRKTYVSGNMQGGGIGF